MTLTKEEYARIDKMHNQSPTEKCEDCNDGYHHLCILKKKKGCKCLFCEDRRKNTKGKVNSLSTPGGLVKECRLCGLTKFITIE